MMSGIFGYAQVVEPKILIGSFSWLKQSLDSATTRKQLVQNFCKEVLQTDSLEFLNDLSKSYSPASSVFLYILCRNAGVDRKQFDPIFQKAEKSSLADDFVKNRKFPSKKDPNAKSELDTFDPCTSLGDMQQCNFSEILPKTFDLLINEYANIKQVTFYGYINDKESIEDQIKRFSKDYFEDGSLSSCAANNAPYLSKNINTDSKTDQCSHPKTYVYVKQSIENSKNLINSRNLQILNPQPVLKIFGANRTLQSIAFEAGMGMEPFQNIVYNELMWYNLFLSSYRYALLSNLQLQNNLFGSVEKIKNSQQEEIDALSKAVSNSQRAVPLMMRMMKNIAYTFPIHIGMLAYYEDLIAFRNTLARIYTPIDQLYYKLRNVQDTK